MFRGPRAGAEEAERGFTLVELMCVVLIIALLLAIGLPTWSAARERASDSAAKAVLTEGHHALKVVLSDYREISTVTTADLDDVEPSLTYHDAVTGADARSNEVSVEVAVTAGTDYVILSTYSHGTGCVAIRELEGAGTAYARLPGTSCPAAAFDPAAGWSSEWPPRP
jgi:prepilin-type N-terminal cleavage/methylation domain-containing protein